MRKVLALLALCVSLMPTPARAVATITPPSVVTEIVGTWTPTDISGASIPITVNSATYIKIGQLVFVQIDITYTASVSAAQAQISLPFTPLASVAQGIPLITTTASLNFAGFIPTSSAGMFFVSGTPSARQTNAVMATGGSYRFAGTYESDS